MSTYSLQNIINNYELLSHDDPSVRESANLYLMGLIYQDNAWKITEVTVHLLRKWSRRAQIKTINCLAHRSSTKNYKNKLQTSPSQNCMHWSNFYSSNSQSQHWTYPPSTRSVHPLRWSLWWAAYRNGPPWYRIWSNLWKDPWVNFKMDWYWLGVWPKNWTRIIAYAMESKFKWRKRYSKISYSSLRSFSPL